MISKFSVVVSSESSDQLIPLWDDELKIIKEREQEEQFFRIKIEGTISFVNENFDFLENASLDSKFEVIIKDNGTGDDLASGVFYKTDVEFDYDNKIASTKITPLDEYSLILDHLEDEIDVLSLGLPTHPLNISKRTILQLYVLGDTKLTNVVGNQSYEVDAIPEAPSMTRQEVLDKKFSFISEYVDVVVELNQSATPAEIEIFSEPFSGNLNDKLWNKSRTYYLANAMTVYGNMGVFRADGTQLENYTMTITEGAGPGTGPVYRFVPSVSQVKIGERTTEPSPLFGRILCDKQTNFKEEDNVFTSSAITNYRYVNTLSSTLVSILDKAYIRSDETIPESTKWGIASNGQYFTRPQVAGGTLIPVGWILWGKYSLWVNIMADFRLPSFLSVWDSVWNLKDAYPLFDTIQKMFDYWDIPVVIQDSSACSLFFSGNSSEESEIRALLPMHSRQTLYITPITNLEKTFYDTAARKMTLSLRDIFQMLKGCFNVYWDLKKDGVGNTLLRLEHLSFYELGLTYDRTQLSYFVDTEDLIHPLIKKAWSYGQSKTSYDISDLPSRYEFKWPTECTDVFDGFAIQVDNKYVLSNRKKEISIPRFFSDVDLVMSTPDAFSDDSVALLGSTDGEKVTRQQLGPLNGIPELPNFFTQNGFLSFLYLELTYHRWSLSGDSIHAEDFPGSDTAQRGSMIAQSVKRFRNQTINIPYSPSIIHTTGNIKTPIGVGIPEKMTYNLDSCMSEIELLQEN